MIIKNNNKIALNITQIIDRHPQTRSSSALPPPAKLPPTVQPANPKRKRSAKGKEPMDGGRSRTSHEEDEGWRASKQLRVMP